jgi:hypothetical protein
VLGAWRGPRCALAAGAARLSLLDDEALAIERAAVVVVEVRARQAPHQRHSRLAHRRAHRPGAAGHTVVCGGGGRGGAGNGSCGAGGS